MKELSSNIDIVILKADKGNSTVVMDRSSYDSKMIEMLSDEKTYKELKAHPAKKSETKMKTLLRAKKDKFRGHVYKKLNTTDGLIPKLYGLPKIHKEGVPLRPIVSFVVSPNI